MIRPAVERDDFWGDMANTFLLRPVYRKPRVEPKPASIPFEPKVAPFGFDVTPEMVQEVWDTFVVPDQYKDIPQSAEMRVLMAILRAAYVSVGGKQ